MLEFIKDILPRIKRFSKDLDKSTKISSKPWVDCFSDPNMKILFKNDNSFQISREGEVTIWKWELSSQFGGIILEINNNRKLYISKFYNEAVWFLKLDNSKNDWFALVNMSLVPDGDVKSYLINLVKDTREILLNDGRVIVCEKKGYYDTNEFGVENRVNFKEGLAVEDGYYIQIKADYNYLHKVRNSMLDRSYGISTYDYKGSVLMIAYPFGNPGVHVGCPVLLDGKPSPTRKYNIGLFKSIYVQDGYIV